MSTTEPEFHPEDFEGLNPAQTTIHNAELRKLRKQAQKAAELETKVAEMERREAFGRAGVPLDHPAADYLVRGYQGEMSPQAIKAEAIRLGIVPSTAATPAEVAAHEAAAAAAAGGIPPSGTPDYAAQLAEMAKQRFAPADDQAMQEHITKIAQLAKQAGATIPVN